MIKSGAVAAGAFVTKSAGALSPATVGPVGALYKNGVANAASVTISGANPYKWSVTLPTLAAGDVVQMYITATVDSVATAAFVWGDIGDTKLVSDLNDISGTIDANLVQIDGKDTDGGPAVTNRPKLYLKLLDLTSDDSAAPLLIQNTTGPTEGPAVDINGQVDISGDVPGGGALLVNNTTASGLGGYGAVFVGLTSPIYPDFIGADGDTLETLSDQLDGVLTAASTSGTGSSTLTYTVTDSVTGLPLADCKVWATTDIPGNNIVAGDVTTTLGVVTLFLDPGTYYVWLRKAGHTFVNPDTVVVA